VADPEKVYSLDLSQLDLEFVIEEDLPIFSNLNTLDASENVLPFARLGLLPALKKLNFSCNALKSLDLDVEGKFQKLEHLDLQSNCVDRSALIVLATLPRLKHLDLTRNCIKILHDDFHNMTNWKDRVIELILHFKVAPSRLDTHLVDHHIPSIPVQPANVESLDPLFLHCVDSIPMSAASACPIIERNIGFQMLETLVLDYNPEIANSSTFWAILSPLQKYRCFI
jgi:hypothetical protein